MDAALNTLDTEERREAAFHAAACFALPSKPSFLHKVRMIYGRLCCFLWLRLPDSVAFESGLGDHLLSWAGYWTHGDRNHGYLSSPNDEMMDGERKATSNTTDQL